MGHVRTKRGLILRRLCLINLIDLSSCVRWSIFEEDEDADDQPGCWNSDFMDFLLSLPTVFLPSAAWTDGQGRHSRAGLDAGTSMRCSHTTHLHSLNSLASVAATFIAPQNEAFWTDNKEVLRSQSREEGTSRARQKRILLVCLFGAHFSHSGALGAFPTPVQVAKPCETSNVIDLCDKENGGCNAPFISCRTTTALSSAAKDLQH